MMVGLAPESGGTAGERERHEEKREGGDHEDDADHVELPEELREDLEAETLKRRHVAVQVPVALRSALSDVQHRQQQNGADCQALARAA